MKSDLIMLTVDMRFLEERTDQAIQLLVSVSGRIEAKSGSKDCFIMRDSTSKTQVRYSEAWESEEAFRRHLLSEEFRRVLFVMEMCCKEPLVTIGNFSGRTGLAYLQQICEWQDSGAPSLADKPREKTA